MNNLAYQLNTGAAASPVQQPNKDLFFPLRSSIWADRANVSYSFDGTKGVFKGTKGAMLFAPEAGILTPVNDGGFVLAVTGSDNTREWMGGFVPGLDSKFQKGELVQAGQLLGQLGADLVLGLHITPKADPSGDRLVDPVDVLQRGNATFTDLTGGAAQANTDLATRPQATDIQPAGYRDILCDKPGYSGLHLALAVSGGLFAGFLITKAFRTRY